MNEIPWPLRFRGRAARALGRLPEPVPLRREGSLAHGFVQLTGACRASRRATEALVQDWAAFVAAGR